MTPQSAKHLLLVCLFFCFAGVFPQYTTAAYYDEYTTTTYYNQYTTTTYYNQYTTTTSSYLYQTQTTPASEYYSSSYTSPVSYYDSSSYSYPPEYLTSTSSATYYSPSSTTHIEEDPAASTHLPGPEEKVEDPTTATKAWYETTAGKWGLAAGGTSCCMTIIGFGAWCIKKRHRKAAKGIYSKLNGKHGKKGHDPTGCAQCSMGYAGAGQAQPFLYDPHGHKQMPVAWQPQGPNGAWSGNA